MDGNHRIEFPNRPSAILTSSAKPIMARRKPARKPSAPKEAKEASSTSTPNTKGTSTKSPEGLAILRAQVLGEPVTPEQVFASGPSTIAGPSTTTNTSTNKGKMAARNRPRNGAVKEDPDEELSMWNQIKKDLEKCSAIQKRAKIVSQSIIEMEEKIGKCMFLTFVRRVPGCNRAFLSPVDLFYTCLLFFAASSGR